jgi:hemerythrin
MEGGYEMNFVQIFEWSDKFLSGHTGMDLTHREFVSMVEALRSCPDWEIPGRLGELLTHCADHFSDEQQLMELHDFPATECHVNEHAAVHRSIAEVMTMTDKASQAEVARRLADQLAHWFGMHLTYLDSALAHWVVKRTHGGIPVVIRRDIPFAVQALD